MENNAYKQINMKINGKNLVIPEKLTFAQVMECEDRGLGLEEMQTKPFKTVTIIYSVLVNKTFEESVEELDKAFEDGELDPTDALTHLLPLYTNFLVRRSK
jgi:hypothetical protein